MHQSAFAWTIGALTADEVKGKIVVEAGGMNVNGSVRPNIEYLGPASYTSTDMRSGPGVDRVLDAARLFELGPADVIICNEMLEHAEDWQQAMLGMILAMAPDGILVITTRSAGFPYHDHPGDHWRFPVESMQRILHAAGLVVDECVPDSDPNSPGVFAKARKPEGWGRWEWERAAVAEWADIPVGKP